MSGAATTSRSASAIDRFADGLLASDLPELCDERRREAVEFIGRRVEILPSITRFGVRLIGASVNTLGAIIGDQRARTVALKLPVPLLSEYPRLIRSLGFAYVWETWPDTRVDGAVMPHTTSSSAAS